MFDPTVKISPFARIGSGVSILDYSVIGRFPSRSPALARQPEASPYLSIGDGTVIGCHVTIYAGVTIGRDCIIGDYASIREGTVIGDRCVIGRQVTINYEAVLGNDVRLQDNTHITGNCRIGDGCFFGPGILTSNDRNVDLVDYHFPEPMPPIFGNRVMVGSGANILAGVRVGDGALIGAGALVVKDVAPGAKVLGPYARAVRSRIDTEAEAWGLRA